MGDENKNKDKIELTEEEFLAKIKENNLGDYLAKYTQKISDKRTSEGIDTFKKNLEKKDLSDKERILSLETELKEMKDNKAKDDKKTLVITELKKQNLSDGFLKYIKIDDLDDQSKIVEAVKNFKDDLLNARQAEIDQKLKGETPPVKGISGNGGDSTLETYVENKNAGKIAGNPFAGKLEK